MSPDPSSQEEVIKQVKHQHHHLLSNKKIINGVLVLHENEFESNMVIRLSLIVVLSYINIQSHAFLTKGVTCSFIPTMINTKSLTSKLFIITKNNNDSDGDHLQQRKIMTTDTGKENYKKPQFSKSFMEHMKKVRGEERADVEEGIDCTGEPSIDPSRRVQDDGLDSEYLNDYFDNR
jgi:hypothetical protein